MLYEKSLLKNYTQLDLFPQLSNDSFLLHLDIQNPAAIIPATDSKSIFSVIFLVLIDSS